MATYRRMLKLGPGVVLTEEAHSKWWGYVVATSYNVTSRRTSYAPTFSTLGEAERYFDEEALRVLNPTIQGQSRPVPVAAGFHGAPPPI